MSNNNFKILLKSKAGVELKKWLDDNAAKLKNQRIFYILKANLEKGDVFKIGLSERGGNSAYGRLNDYYHFYGKTNKENPCKGVKLYLVIAYDMKRTVPSRNRVTGTRWNPTGGTGLSNRNGGTGNNQ